MCTFARRCYPLATLLFYSTSIYCLHVLLCTRYELIYQLDAMFIV